MITFTKKDDVHLHFDGDRSDMQSLSEWFTFEAPNAHFSPAYQNKFWDGKIRLVNLGDQTVPAGLALKIAEFAKMTDTDIKFDISVDDLPCADKPVPSEVLDEFLKRLDPHDDRTPLVYDDYQYDAINYAIKKERCLLVSPTSSGKSLIAYSIVRWVLNIQPRRILLIVPTTGLVVQLAKDFRNYSQYQFDDICTSIKGEHLKSDARVMISTWQSITNLPKDWFGQFGAVIVDEVHHAEAKSLQYIMRQLTRCPFRIGLTGSLKDAKTHQLTLIGSFGPIKQVTTTKELMNRGRVSELEIRLMHLHYPKEISKALRKEIAEIKEKEGNAYLPEIELIKTHVGRNEFICKLAVDAPGCTLVTFKDLEHGEWLYNRISQMTERTVLYVSGKTDTDDREAARAAAEADDIIIVASLGVFSTGVNIKKLHNLVFAHPTKSKTKVLQSIGRILRKSPDGRSAIMYDIIDDLRSGKWENYAWDHAAERFAQYMQEEHKTRTFHINL